MARNPFPMPARFWLNVEPSRSDDECWPWTGATSRGYGHFTLMGPNAGEWRAVPAHRLAYELEIGPIPEGLHVDHLCRVPACVNPAHLEAVTNAENVLRGAGHTARNARKTHCTRGHEFTPENTYTSNGGRQCKTCVALRDATRDRKVRKPEPSSEAPVVQMETP